MFCEHCGKHLADNQAFCDNCGTSTARTPIVAAPSRKFRCPHCGSDDLYPIASTETTFSSSGGGFSAGKGCLGYLLLGPIGLLCGACGSKTKTNMQQSTKNYWSCRFCGKKFLDIDNLNALLEQEKANLSSISLRLCFAVIFALLGGIYLLSVLNEVDGFSEAVYGILLIIVIIMPFVVLAQRSKSKQRCEELEQEKAFLEQYAYGRQDASR